LVDMNSLWTVNKDNILYKCKWSPFEGTTFQSKIVTTIASGNVVWDEGNLIEGQTGMRLAFER